MSAKKCRRDTMILLFTSAIASAFAECRRELERLITERKYIEYAILLYFNCILNFLYSAYITFLFVISTANIYHVFARRQRSSFDWQLWRYLKVKSKNIIGNYIYCGVKRVTQPYFITLPHIFWGNPSFKFRSH